MRRLTVGAVTAETSAAYVEGTHYLYVVTDDGTRLTIVWGIPALSDANELVALWTTEAEGGPHRALFDGGAIEQVHGEVLMRVHGFLQDRRTQLGQKVTRQAIVFPYNLAGTTIAGYYAVFDPPYTMRIFGRRAAALYWLGCDGVRDEVEALVTTVSTEDPLLAGMRRLLAEPGAGLGIVEVARRLRTSVRTLQRRLRLSTTTFVDEAARARVARAQRLMLETDLKLDAIAREVGSGTAPAFSALFKRITGASPTDWRAGTAR